MKKILKKPMIPFLILLIIGQMIIFGILLFDWSKKNNALSIWEALKFEKLNYVEGIIIQPDKSELEQIQEIKKSPKDLSEVKVTGWIPDWDYKDGFDSFSSVSPFWFLINEQGELEANPKANDYELISYANNNDIELLPSITCFDAATLHIILENSENTKKLVTDIIKQAVNNNYSGIDLDFESIYLKDNESFFEFVKTLSLELIKNDKKFSFTVLPKWGERDVIYHAFPETRKNLNYKRIADFVDEFRIMTYEYSGKSNQYYGPVGPITWLEDVLRYAILVGVPRDKIVIGVHTFSYDYSEREKMPVLDYYPVLAHTFDDSKPSALAYYNTIIEKIMSERKVEVTFDNEWGEAIGRYKTDEGDNRILVFPNQKSLDLRKQLAADYGIRGVAYWRIGDEGELEY